MKRQPQGFTLIELVVVILLLGILSAYGASKFIGVSSYSAYVVQEQAVSVIRQLQIYRMQSNSATENSAFQLAIRSDCLGSVAACNVSDADAETRSDVIRPRDLTLSANSSTVSFDLLGNPLIGSPLQSAKDGVNIVITGGESPLYVCINPVGYVFAGRCL